MRIVRRADNLTRSQFAEWCRTAPTQADADQWITPIRPDIVTAWRAAHPEATCNDRVAYLLAELELAVRAIADARTADAR